MIHSGVTDSKIKMFFQLQLTLMATWLEWEQLMKNLFLSTCQLPSRISNWREKHQLVVLVEIHQSKSKWTRIKAMSQFLKKPAEMLKKWMKHSNWINKSKLKMRKQSKKKMEHFQPHLSCRCLKEECQKKTSLSQTIPVKKVCLKQLRVISKTETENKIYNRK
jgi:asparagine synthetase B (glutamine-hydrolysing)